MARFAPVYMSVYDGLVTLPNLVLSDNSLAVADADPGDIVGELSGMSPGSTLSLTGTDANRFALSGSNLVVGATALTAGTYNVIVRETNADADNEDGYYDTAFVITVTA